jgi:hypothetical protein
VLLPLPLPLPPPPLLLLLLTMAYRKVLLQRRSVVRNF